MTTLKQKIRARSTREQGATAVEFGLTIGLIATLVVVGASYFSEALSALVAVADATL